MAISTRNSFVALDVNTDSVASAGRRRRAHDEDADSEPAQRRELAHKSWKRSLTAGVTQQAETAPIALDPLVQIFSAEHLVAAVDSWTCSAAPIHDPTTGELIGIVDLTVDSRAAYPHTLSVAELAARASVGELQALEGGGAILWLNRSRPRSGEPHLRLRLLGQTTSAQLETSSPERALRSLELLALLAMHPDGLSAEQLALALYGERGKAVTVRAQVHRVRAHLGQRTLQTQPYRLLVPVDADWLAVQRLVSVGQPHEALRAYCGPLLPTSDAPAIVEARRLLDESLRRSIVSSADPELLCRWLAHSSGADDLVAARTLVAVLPGGDPRRAAATATAAAIAQRLSA